MQFAPDLQKIVRALITILSKGTIATNKHFDGKCGCYTMTPAGKAGTSAF